MEYPQYAYILEQTTDVENEWVPVRVYLDEKMADLACERAQVGAQNVVFCVQEIELVS